MSKRRRMKRLFPKKFASDYIKAPRIDHNKAAAYSAQRSKATFGSKNDVQHKPDSNFMSAVPRTKSLSTYDPDWNEWVRSQRGEVVDAKHELLRITHAKEQKRSLVYMKVWQGQRHQGVLEYHRKVMEESDGYSIVMFFSGTEVLFVMEIGNKRWISCTYAGLEVALRQYKTNNISWITTEPIS